MTYSQSSTSNLAERIWKDLSKTPENNDSFLKFDVVIEDKKIIVYLCDKYFIKNASFNKYEYPEIEVRYENISFFRKRKGILQK